MPGEAWAVDGEHTGRQSAAGGVRILLDHRGPLGYKYLLPPWVSPRTHDGARIFKRNHACRDL